MSSIVLSSQDVRELRDLFQKGGCSDELSRESRRNLNLLKGEEIIAVVAKGRGGITGAMTGGSNCFADFSVDGIRKYPGPFSTIITNCRFIFIEPNAEVRLEDLRAYSMNRDLMRGRPKYGLTLDDREITFLASMPIGTGAVGSWFNIMMASENDQKQNFDKALAFLSACEELLRTIGAVWERQDP